MRSRTPVYGLLAEFETADAVLDAARQAYRAGYREMDAFTPYTVEGLAAALGAAPSRMPSLVFLGGLAGGAVGFFMQYWAMAVDYPINSGGRPYNSWPVFIPIAFEVLVLIASFSAFFGMLFLSGFPRLHHPLFAEPRFARASQDRFFLCIEATDPRYDERGTRDFLAGLRPVDEVVVIRN
jgi:hypothetical protein